MSKLRIGMIGVCGRGEIAKYWKDNSRSEVVAGADISEASLADFKSRIGESVYTTLDYNEMLRRKDVDAVAICTPDFAHEEQAIAALKAGKHVYLEKPIAITIEGCDRIIRAERESKKKLMVGFNLRCVPMYRIMKGIVESGAIGDIKAVWVRHFVGWGGFWFFHDWHGTKANCNSLLLQKGTHDIDVIHWITGAYTKRVTAFGDLDFYGGDKPNDLFCPDCEENKTCPEAQFKTNTQCAKRSEIDIEDNNFLLMQMERGIKAAYLECHFTEDSDRNFVFIGTKGRMECSEETMQVWVKTRRTNDWSELSDTYYDVKEMKHPLGTGDPEITDAFIDYIIDDKPPVASSMDGRMSIAVGCCGAESMRNGGMPIDIPEIKY